MQLFKQGLCQLLKTWPSSQSVVQAPPHSACPQQPTVSLLGSPEKLSFADRAWQLQADLESIRSNLLQRHGAYVNLTGDERLLQAAQPLVSDFLQAMPAQAGQDADWSSSLPRINEAITVPTQVCLSLVHRSAGYSDSISVQKFDDCSFAERFQSFY